MSGVSLALSNMRAVVILLVLSFHSVLAYLDFLPAQPYRFDAPPYQWQAFAIIDSRRFFPFDLFCAWQDVCLMSILFFLSGLFVWPSLSRKGGTKFLSDRMMRIALPCALVVLLVSPVTYYPTYRVTAADPSLAEYWRQWQSLPFWPCGPQWFLWQLIAMNLIVGGLHALNPRWGERLAALASHARERPLHFLGGLMVLSAVTYVPMALIYTPWDWTHFGPVAFQICRPLHYSVFFFAGMSIGAYGLERGILATDGPLARHAPAWIAGAVAGFIAWIVPTSFTYGDDPAPLWLQAVAGLGFVLACASGCFAAVATFLRWGRTPRRFLDSLSANAYGMYLNHYVFVVWLQFALLGAPLPGAIKALAVFGATLAISWPLAAGLSNFSFAGRTVRAQR